MVMDSGRCAKISQVMADGGSTGNEWRRRIFIRNEGQSRKRFASFHRERRTKPMTSSMPWKVQRVDLLTAKDL